MGAPDNAKNLVTGLLIGLLIGLSIMYGILDHNGIEPPQIDKELVYEEIMAMDAHTVVEHYLPGITVKFMEQTEGQSARVIQRLWVDVERLLAEYYRGRADDS